MEANISATYTKPSILEKWLTASRVTANPGPLLGMGVALQTTAGLFTAPSLTLATGSDGATHSAAAVTLALRPA
jgi:hypothetical protein